MTDLNTGKPIMYTLKPNDPLGGLRPPAAKAALAHNYVLLLHTAKRILQESFESYVCNALREAAMFYERTYNTNLYKECRALERWIQDVVPDKEIGVEAWLKEQGIPERDLTKENLKEYRLRWIDHMIKYFSYAAMDSSGKAKPFKETP